MRSGCYCGHAGRALNRLAHFSNRMKLHGISGSVSEVTFPSGKTSKRDQREQSTRDIDSVEEGFVGESDGQNVVRHRNDIGSAPTIEFHHL